PLPRPLAPGVRILPAERPRQLDPARASGEVALVQRSRPLDVPREIDLDRARQHSHSVLAPFAVADRDLVRREIDVLDPQAAAFEEAEPRAVEEQRHQAGRAIQLLEDRPDLLAGEDRGQVLRAFGTDEAVEPRKLDAEDLTVQKEKSVKSFVLRRRGDTITVGQSSKKRVIVVNCLFCMMALAV